MLVVVEEHLTLALVQVDWVVVEQVDRIVLVFLQLMELLQLVVVEEEVEIFQQQMPTTTEQMVVQE
jgi:hypothetical protein